MTYAAQGHSGLEYYPCRYGRSRVLFRGPRRKLTGDFVAFLGGTETYGRFIQSPYPALVERAIGMPCVNFGSVNAGIDLYLHDPSVLEAAGKATVTVIQVMGAQNMSNRYYSVHPRRNDRFLRASKILQSIYADVDFTEFHFNRHMLRHLQGLSPDRFELIAEELRAAWIARMKHVLGVLPGQTLLLWFADHPPPDTEKSAIEGDPLFVDRSMIEAIRPRVTAVIEVNASRAARAEATQGMIFNDFEACAAAEQMGPRAHEEAAEAVTQALRRILPGESAKPKM